MSATVLAVALTAATYASPDDSKLWPSRQLLTRRTGLSVSSVSRALTLLRRLDYLAPTMPGDQGPCDQADDAARLAYWQTRHQATRYRLTLPRGHARASTGHSDPARRVTLTRPQEGTTGSDQDSVAQVIPFPADGAG